ncbi:MAG: tRNA (adenine-N1)-methyltransferase [Candidatus Thermoplasmatota archaeon]
MNKIEDGETVVLIDSKYRKYLINTSEKVDKYKGVGVFDPSILIDKKIGSRIEIGNKKFWVLKPSLMDKIHGLKRKAQIILPKDSAQILLNCSISSNQSVLEAGIGSGGLTIVLANAVAPNGRVISYDKRKDFIKHAKLNIKKSGFENIVQTKIQDVTEEISEKNLDSIILDIPNPWDAVENACSALKKGGYLCCYSPNSTQVEKTVKKIEKNGFIEIKTYENIQRRIVVSDKGMRPSFKMLGHTGYLTFARKI